VEQVKAVEKDDLIPLSNENVERRPEQRQTLQSPAKHQSLFKVLGFVLALAEIRQFVEQVKAVEKEDLMAGGRNRWE